MAAPLAPLFEGIPQELRTLTAWVLWRLIPLPEGRWTKVPFQPDGKHARSNDPTTWTDFETVKAAYGRGGFSGIGFMLEGTDLVGIDLDDKEGSGVWLTSDGSPTPALREILADLDTYAELSPSGKGVRLFARGTISRSGRKGPIEVYASGSPRFLTVTGRKLSGVPESIEERTEALTRFHRHYITSTPIPLPRTFATSLREGEPEGLSSYRNSPSPGQSFLLGRGGQGGEVGAKYQALWRGDISGYGGDHSAADLALIGFLLAQAKGDAAEADRLFRQSGLMRPKWDQRHSADGRTYGQLTLEKARVSARNPLRGDSNVRPVLVVNGRQQWQIARDVWQHLSAANRTAPTLFYREASGQTTLCRLTRTADGVVGVQPLHSETLAHLLRRACDLTTRQFTEKSGVRYAPAQLPRWLPIDMVSGAEAREHLPRLRTVVGCPVITAAGELLQKPGYDPASALYLDAPEVTPRAGDDVVAALKRLFVPFEEFPYQSSGDRANAIALLLTPFLRHYIKGSVPLCFVEAPTPGTGKSLLARCLLLLSTPSVVVSGGPSERERGAEEEWSKQLPALLTHAPAALLLDNLRGTIASATLELLLTAEGMVQMRRLGKSDETQAIDVSGLTIAATGNNATLPRDMARRCYFVRIDAGVEAPETRTGFQISDLAAHIRTHRVALLSDVLIVLSAWIAAGRPLGHARKGSFDHWAAVLSGVLELCGVEGFLASDTERAEDADTETIQWRGFFHAWHQQAGDSSKTAKELVVLAIEHEIVMDTLGASRSLGKRLQAMRGRVFGEWRLQSSRGKNGFTLFSLSQTQNGNEFDEFNEFSACHRANEKERNT